jgi:hypothetical protein
LGRRVFLLDATDLTPVGQSEEHLVLQVDETQSVPDRPSSPETAHRPQSSPSTAASALYPAGHVLYGMPFHVCPTVALYERAYTIEGGRLTGEWRNSARDRKITI